MLLAGPYKASIAASCSEPLTAGVVLLGVTFAESNVPVLAVGAVESAFAIFSEMTRIRPAWARSPEAATAIVFVKSKVHLRLSFAKCCLDQAEAARVERACGLVVHLVLRDLEHLILDVHAVTAWAGLHVIGPHGLELRFPYRSDVCRIGRRELQCDRRRRTIGRSLSSPGRKFGMFPPAGAACPGGSVSGYGAPTGSGYRSSAL